MSKLEKHAPIFLNNTESKLYPCLKEDMEVEFAIIGGGLAGISLAYLLKHMGKRVAVFEANQIGMGTSLRTTAKLTIQHGLIYDKLMHTKSPGKAKQYADANRKAIEFVKETISKEQIECNFMNMPSYIYTTDEKYIKAIQDEAEACKRLGIEVNYKDQIPLPIKVKAALEWEGAALFNPKKYISSLAEKFTANGGCIFEETPITRLVPGEVSVLETDKGCKVSARRIVIASHYPMYDGLGLYFTRLNMQRIYVLGLKVDKEKLPKGSFISVDSPIRSIRPIYEQDIVLIGGGHHRVGDDQYEATHFEELKQFGKEVFNSDEVYSQWSLQDYVTPDSVPYIGYLNSSKYHNIYVATGFNKWGMSNATNAALVLKDLLLMGTSPFEDLFNPQRLSAYKGKTFINHNIEGIKNYIQGKLRTVPKDTFPDKGEAIVAELEDGNVYGIYQDEEEHYHIVDIICPHVGARLRWNSAEKSWDCPFHGSRFNIDGEVLQGPSTHKLNGYKEGKNKIHPNLI